MNKEYETDNRADQCRAVIRGFPTLDDLTRWFDETQCDFRPGQGILAGRPLEPWEFHQQIPIAKKKWLRNAENEAWYHTRLGLMVSAWEFCRQRHGEIEAAQRSQICQLRETIRDSQSVAATHLKGKEKAEAMLTGIFHGMCHFRGKTMLQYCQDIARNFPHLPVPTKTTGK